MIADGGDNLPADRAAALIAQDEDAPPEGFSPIGPVGNFDVMIGRVWGRREGDQLVMGFRCNPRHLNGHGTCHGGMLASFADMLAYATRVQAGIPDVSVPTVSLAVEYLIPVLVGDWVEGRCEVTKRGARLLFSRAIASVDGRPVFTATAINVPSRHDPVGGAEVEAIMANEELQPPAPKRSKKAKGPPR